jgi:hypothetical protein
MLIVSGKGAPGREQPGGNRMRKLGPFLGVLLFGLFQPGIAAAQEVGQSVTLTGCLAQEDEGGETEFLLENTDWEADEVELMATEGVNLAPHVGHTVEVGGTIVGDDDEGYEDDDGEAGMQGEADEADDEGMDEDGDLHIGVTKLTHLAASCDSD